MRSFLHIKIPINLDAIDSFSELLIARAEMKTVVKGYKEFNLEVPEVLTANLANIEIELSRRALADQMARLRRLNARQLALRTKTQERQDLADEIEKVTKTIEKMKSG